MDILEIKKRAELWLSTDFDEETRSRVKKLFDNDDNNKELTESFYKDLEFGTGGLRGIMGVGTNRMNKYTVGMATQGLSNYLKKQFPDKPLSAAVACDCRNNSPFFAQVVANVFSANGIKVYLFSSLRPTPELSFAVRHFRCSTGVMITASHNPKEYNGYKAYWDDGAQVTFPHDANIVEEANRIKSVKEVNFEANPELIVAVGEEVDAVYLEKLKTLLLSPETIKKHSDIKIVYTPLHGTGVKLVPEFLNSLGFKNIIHVPEQDINDGNFPTVVSPNPEESSALTLALKKAQDENADLVMATDPDADRVGIAVRNNKGELQLLNGNQTASILTYYCLENLSRQKRLKGNEYIVRTVVTTHLLTTMAKYYGVEIFDTLTGFKYIAEIIRKYEGTKTFICGGEESYGFLIGDFVRDKDAVVSCGMIAEVAAWAKENGKSLYDLLLDIYLKFGLHEEKLLSITKKGKEGLEEIKAMMKNYRNNPPKEIAGSKVVTTVDYLTKQQTDTLTGNITPVNQHQSDVLQFFTQNGTVVSIRPSGTEPKIKYYCELRSDLNDKNEYDAILKQLNDKYLRIIDELG
ncbi:MAG: phospho-sugar mutase [Prevotellaceae bacterium]|jgi:phosphoglucomutase|nr:phospho-sugar mutase [Prevotellaceae bacterium]